MEMERFESNGDIFFNDKLVCHSYPAPIPIDDVSQIKERVIKKTPTFDGTVIRAYYTTEWKLATFKKNAFESKWKSEKTFGELFEKHKPLAMLNSFLKKEYCYTFLLIDVECENFLAHTKNELFHISTFDVKTKKNIQEVPFFAQPMPSFSESMGWVDKESSSKGIRLERPQRGLMFYTKNNVYIQDFDYFKFWKNIVKDHSHNDTFWYLVRTRDAKFVKEFCDMYGDKFASLHYYFEAFVELCCGDYDDALVTKTDTFKHYYRDASTKKMPRSWILSLHNTELNMLCSESKEIIEEKE